METAYSRLRGGVDAVLQSTRVLPIDLRYECIAMLGFSLHLDLGSSAIQQAIMEDAVDTLFSGCQSEKIATSFDCVIRDILLAEASSHSQRQQFAKHARKGGLPRKLEESDYLAKQRLSCVKAAFDAWQDNRKESYRRSFSS